MVLNVVRKHVSHLKVKTGPVKCFRVQRHLSPYDVCLMALVQLLEPT